MYIAEEGLREELKLEGRGHGELAGRVSFPAARRRCYRRPADRRALAALACAPRRFAQRTGKASAQAAGENRENDGQENLRLASGPLSAMPCCAGAIAAQQARIGAEKRHQDEHGGGWKVVKDGAAAPSAGEATAATASEL